MVGFRQNSGRGEGWSHFSQIQWKWQRKLKNDSYSNKKGEDMLKKTDPVSVDAWIMMAYLSFDKFFGETEFQLVEAIMGRGS